MKLAILDLKSVMIANLMVGLSKAPKGSVMLDEGILRHMILSQMLNIRRQYKEYEFVVACDMTNSWRRDHFPYYKYRRKQTRDNMGIDWVLVEETFTKLRQELHDFFPYRVVMVPRAEADDVIGTLCHRFGHNENEWFNPTVSIVILSGDQDFIQLQKYPNIGQYDPIRKRVLLTDAADRYLFDHICTGDTGDGIPNILSPSDTFVTRTRQKAVRQVALDAWWELYQTKGYDEENKQHKVFLESTENFIRNRRLIDLSRTPAEMKQLINTSFDSQKGKDKRQLMNYMIQHRLRTLTESLSEF